MNIKTGFSVILSVIFTLTVTSCIPQRKVILVKDVVEEVSEYTPTTNITERYVLRPNDYLFVDVTSPDDQTLTAFFNPRKSTGSGGSSSNMSRPEFYYYVIDDSCCIDFPVIGKIDLKGCTVSMAKERISAAISKMTSNFTLICRLATNSFSILGEVGNQGRYTMDKDQITVFDAISTAKGFTSFAKRKDVKVLRKDTDGKVRAHKLDLTSGDVIASEYYYIYPNDVIYVRPMWYKMFGWGETMSFALISSMLSLIAVMISIKNRSK